MLYNNWLKPFEDDVLSLNFAEINLKEVYKDQITMHKRIEKSYNRTSQQQIDLLKQNVNSLEAIYDKTEELLGDIQQSNRSLENMAETMNEIMEDIEQSKLS